MKSSPDSIRLHLLAAPRLEHDGVFVTVNRRKALALLAYLVVTRQSHLRDTVASLLWPDSGQTLARANLRHALVELKQLVGADGLAIEGDTVAFRQPPGFWADVLHFQSLLDACASHGHGPNDVCAGCLPALREAVAMPADQFMAGFSLADSPAFDDWQRAQQQRLSRTLGDLFDRLARYYIQAADYKAAIDHAQRRVELDELDEAAHRQLMQLYGWSGQQGLAMRQFEQCAAILANELGVSPSTETVGLMQYIQTGSLMAHQAQAHAGNGQPSPARVENVLQTALTPRHNLPVRLPTLIGREQDVAALCDLLQRGDVNLVTLVGPGGVGKTQLSLRIASILLDHFDDGVFFVSLAPLRDAELVVSALAQTWNLQHEANNSLFERVQSHLRDKRMLLILDNFDHLMAAAPLISELVANCAHLRVIVNSRELLNVHGEQIYAVRPLSLPKRGERPSVNSITEAAAVQLFVQRAQAIYPSFVLDETNAVDIAEICTYLDGLPLAIELIAARIRLLPPRLLRQRLMESSISSFELLRNGVRDAPMRHRSFRNAIAPSYELLSGDEQRLLRLLSVFVGGCSLEAIEHLCATMGAGGDGQVLDLLASLVNKSLVQQTTESSGESRFSLLELIREYAQEHLQQDDDFAIAARAHAETYAVFAEMAGAALSGPGHLAWRARLNADHSNCRAAIHWAIAQQQAELSIRLGVSLWGYWFDQGNFREGRQILASILQLAGVGGRTSGRARLLTGLGAMCRMQGDMVEAKNALQEAVSICQEMGDERGLAMALERIADGCYLELGLPRVNLIWAEAAELYEKVNDPVGAARIRQQLGNDYYHAGDHVAAEKVFAETLAVYEEQGYEAGLGLALCNVGRALFQQQKFVESKQRLNEALSRAQMSGDQWLVARTLYFLGRTAYYQDEFAKAKRLLEQCLHIYRELGTKSEEASFPMAFISDILLAEGEVAAAQSMLQEALTSVFQVRHKYAISLILPHFASLAVAGGLYMRAVQLAAAGYTLYQTLGNALPPNDQAAFDAPLSVARHFLLPEEYAQAWADGEQMTMADAVALALAETTGVAPSRVKLAV